MGIASTVGYAREGITSYEMYDAQRTAARWGRVTADHHRFAPSAVTPIETPIGADEVLVNAMILGAPLQIHHNNDYGWWEVEEKLKLARSKGHNVWSTWYPWMAGSGNIGSSIVQPDSWEKGMGLKYEETIYDPIQDKFLTKQEFLRLSKDDPGRIIVAFAPDRKEWIKEKLYLANHIIASDGIAATDQKGELLPWDLPYEEFRGHPRAAGSHAKTLRLAREEGVPLMQTLSQLSYWVAKHFGDTGIKSLQVRGRMQEGMVADVVIFDPVVVAERATYKAGESGLPSVGIPYVFVSGIKVVDDSEPLPDIFPGQPIRFPVEENGRFEPITEVRYQ